MRPLINRHIEHWQQTRLAARTVLALAFMLCAVWVNFWAIGLATQKAGPAVPDLILSNVPAVEVDGLFVYGTVIFVILSILVVGGRPNRLPFVFFALGLFIFIRSGFTLLTHLGPPEAFYVSDFGESITKAFFGADQFFSAHSGMPFLGALAFWHNPKIRSFFLAGSLFFATVVLLGHIHYSIDVASAFFITYGIYHIALWLFPTDHKDFLKSEGDFMKDSG